MAAQSPTIRLARKDEAQEVADMWSRMAAQHQAYDADVWCWQAQAMEAWRDAFAKACEQPDMVCLVAENDDRRLCGFAQGAVRRSAPIFANEYMGEVWDLFVLPDCRGRQVGRRLMDEMFERMRAIGATDVILHVALENQAAIALYEKMGMRPVMARMYRKL